jgi:hypothetical protein
MLFYLCEEKEERGKDNYARTGALIGSLVCYLNRVFPFGGKPDMSVVRIPMELCDTLCECISPLLGVYFQS